MNTIGQKKKQLYTGEVISDKMNKTVVVKTTRVYTHPEFLKTVRRNKTYKVHVDQNGLVKVGDLIEFYEGRPASKTKYMYLARVVKSSVSLEK